MWRWGWITPSLSFQITLHWPLFDVLRRRHNEVSAFLYAFDLLELDGVDLRREPLETRKATLASVLRPAVSVPSRITSKAVGSRELCRGLRDYVYGFRGTAHAPGSVFYANDQS